MSEPDGKWIPEAGLVDLGTVGREVVARFDEGIVFQSQASDRVDAQDLAGQTVYLLNAACARIYGVERDAVAGANVERAIWSERQRPASMAPRIDFDVVVDVTPCLGVNSRFGLA